MSGGLQNTGSRSDSEATARSWRGRGSAPRQEPRRGWQADGPRDPLQRMESKRFWARIRLLGLLLGFAGLLGLLLYALLYSPTKTPLVFIGPVEYPWPLPPNAYVEEDLNGLRRLSAALELRHVPDAWRTAESGAENLREQLAEIEASRPRYVPLVLYLRVYGASSENGEPCLLTPSASPRASSSWTPVRRVLQVLQDQVDEARPKLVVLDCVAERRNWAAGVIDNRFVQGLQTLLDSQPAKNLFILSSSGPGEQAHVAAAVGSVFGRAFREGVAGRADKESGNADGGVSVRELHRYVLQRTDQWVQANRQDRQRPQLLAAAGTSDFRVAWALPNPGEEPGPASPATELRRRIDRLWSEYQRLREQRPQDSPEAYAAAACRAVERSLIRAQQLLRGGAAYQEQLQATLDDLESRFTQLEQATDKPAAAYWREWDPAMNLPPSANSLHSLPLLRRYSLQPVSTLQSAQRWLDAVVDDPDPAGLGVRLEELRELLAQNDTPALIEATLPHWMHRFPLPHLNQSLDAIRLAIDLRRTAEELTVPVDARVSRWLHADAERADASRRLLEDELFAGGDSLDSLGQTAQQEYDRLRRRGDAIANALAVHDRLWSQAAAFAWWYTRPRPAAVASDEQLELLSTTLNALIRDGKQLGRVLASPQASEVDVLEAERLAGECSAHLEALRAQFDEEIARLTADDEPAASAVMDLWTALETNLPNSQQRTRLNELAGRLIDQPPRTDAEFTAAGAPAAEGDSPQRDPWRGAWRRSPWASHPALALVDFREEADLQESSSVSLDEQGAALREQLARLYGASLVELTNGQAGGDIRQALAVAAHRWRAAAHWLPQPLDDAVTAVWRFDVQQLVLWHGARAIADKAGPQLAGEPPFSEIVASDCLQYARFEPPRSSRQDELAGAVGWLRQFTQAGVHVAVEQLLLPDQASATRVALRENIDFRSPLEAALGEPSSGRAAVFVRDSDGRILGVAPGVALPLASDEVATSLTVQSPAGRPLNAVALFRGNPFAAEYLPANLAGAVATIRPDKDAATSVVLYGRRKQQASLVFVLDCSQSMEQQIPGETGDGPAPSRMEIAKSTLLEILDDLGRQGDARVGLFLFGHRRGWDREQAGVLRTQSNYQGPIPDNLQPAEDVEEVLPLGRFNSDLADQLADKLATVRPWGQTPLYLSLVRALEALDRDDREAQKSIVIITDGRNYQFTPSVNPLGVFVPQTPQSAVLQRLDGRRVNIHIVSLALQDARDVQAAAAELDNLAVQTGGRHVEVSSAAELVREIRRAIGPGRYSLVDLEGRPAASVSRDGSLESAEAAILDQPLWFTTPPPPAGVYRLILDQIDESFAVWPGRALELGLAPDGQSLRRIPYDQDESALARLGPQQSHSVRTHTAVLRDGVLLLQVSLQDDTQLTTAPPEMLWLTVTPLRGDGAPLEPAYTWYEARFAARQPVPVLRLELENWPEEAKFARVDLSFGAAGTEPAAAIPLSDVLQRPEDYREPQPLPLFDAMQVRIQAGYDGAAFRVMIWETHPAAARDVTRAHVTLRTDEEAQPERITHQFDARQGVAVHTYYFYGEDARRIAASTTAAIEFRERSRMLSQAWKLAESDALVTPVSGSRETLNELVPPANQ